MGDTLPVLVAAGSSSSRSCRPGFDRVSSTSSVFDGCAHVVNEVSEHIDNDTLQELEHESSCLGQHWQAVFMAAAVMQFRHDFQLDLDALYVSVAEFMSIKEGMADEAKGIALFEILEIWNFLCERCDPACVASGYGVEVESVIAELQQSVV